MTERTARSHRARPARRPDPAREPPPARPAPRRLPVEGLPALGGDTLVRVAPAGDRLVVAHGPAVHSYAIRVEEGRAVATHTGEAKLPGAARELLVSADGAVVALVDRPDGGTAVLAIDGYRATALTALDVRPTAAALTRQHLAVAVPGSTVTPPQLLVLRRRDGAVVRREPLATARVRLRAGRGNELLVVEPGGRLRRVTASQASETCPPPGGDVPRPPGRPHDHGGSEPCRCGSGGRSPCGCASGGGRCPPPPRDPGDRPRPHRDPDGACVPGADGDPDGCFVTTVVGGVVVVTNLCDPGEPPCTARLDWPAASVARTRGTVVVTARDGRRLAVFDGRTLRQLYVHHAGRGRLTALVARDADRVFALDAAGAVTLLDVAPLLPAPAGPGGGFDVTLGTTSAVYDGQPQPLQYDKTGPQYGTRRVLLVPMLEPGQGFDGSTEDFARSFEVEAILDTARAFYEEATHHLPPEDEGLVPEFVWFGADTPTLYTGPPLPLPLPWRLYWGPAWDPGAISGTVPLPGGGLVLSFSGDESMVLRAIPAPAETYDPRTFDVRFPAANYRARIPNGLATISLGPGTAPARAISIDGTDRDGNAFSITVDTSALSGTTGLDLVRNALSADTTQQDALADVIEEMLASAPGLGDLFERPSVTWQDDGNQAGMLHVSLSFAAGPGGAVPVVTFFDLDDLLPELGPGSRPARFDLPTDAGALATYLARIVADASVRHPDFGSDLDRSYFDFSERPPTVTTDDGELTVRINLSTNHGRYPAQIELESQVGLASIGMDQPISTAGADTGFSGSGGPQFDASKGLFDEVYTRMIDAVIAQWGGDEAAAVEEFNRYFNCVGLEDSPIECSLGMIHNVLVTPVFPTSSVGGGEPDVADLRGATRSMTMNDQKAGERVAPVLQLASNRSKIAMFIAPDSVDDTTRSSSSASTLAHELGHGLLGLPDLYDADGYRSDVRYVGGYCIMGSSSSRAHFCAYNKRIKGWLADDATLLIDRPGGSESVDQEVVLLQLEWWDPLLDDDARVALAQSLLSGMAADTPVVAAVFLRLGGDGRQFDIVELRGRGDQFSQEIDPPRVVITNAVDPDDDTRYAETELEGAGTTEGVLEAYRRPVHLISDSLRATGDMFDFATEPEFPEVGLRAEVLELGTGAMGSGTIAAARLRIQWDRGPAIDLGFSEGIPDWTSPDIAVIRPDQIDEDGNFTFPESQEEGYIDTYVPAGGEGTLDHKVAVRVWNFGDASALNVQVELVLRVPEGAGDWVEDVIGSRLIDEVPPTATAADAPIVDFDWPVSSAVQDHVCFRAQIGDRDVPRDDNGTALASDDTNAHNDWAQQNVTVAEAPADSPPDPVDFTYRVENGGSYVEEVRLVPRGLRDGARVTVTPARLRIRPRSHGLFRVRVELEERLLGEACGGDVAFLLEAWRTDEHAESRWGAVKYVVKPRRRTETALQGSLMFERLQLVGSVSPDVGAQRVLLHVQRPGQPSLWQRVTLGPASTFDVELPGPWPSGETVLATARFEGTNVFASSVSETLSLVWLPEQ